MKARAFLVVLSLPFLAQASAIYTTSAGATVSDGAVDASATFALVNGNQLQITLTDNLANPKSVGQLISDLQFSISGVTGLSLSSMSSTGITINGNHTPTTDGTVNSGWIEGVFGSGFLLCVICAPSFPKDAAPAELIIGPGPYTNANGSIAGNSPHNPFLYQTATFTLSGTGITSSTSVSNVVFSFGTQFGSDVTGTPGGGGVTLGAGPVPEPGSATLAAGAFGILALVLRRRHNRKDKQPEEETLTTEGGN